MRCTTAVYYVNHNSVYTIAMCTPCSWREAFWSGYSYRLRTTGQDMQASKVLCLSLKRHYSPPVTSTAIVVCCPQSASLAFAHILLPVSAVWYFGRHQQVSRCTIAHSEQVGMDHQSIMTYDFTFRAVGMDHQSIMMHNLTF